MRPYLQIVPRMVIQLDLQCRLPGNASVSSAEIKAIGIALDHIEQFSNTDFIMYSDPPSIFFNRYLIAIFKTSSFGLHVGITGNEKAKFTAKSVLARLISLILEFLILILSLACIPFFIISGKYHGILPS